MTMKTTMQSRSLTSVASKLSDFLSRHDDDDRHGFITRLDRSPVAQKRIAFARALALNVVILVFVASFSWSAIVKDLLGSLPVNLKLAALLTQDIVLLYALLILIQSTTLPFLFGECRLRLHYGFNATEIIMRRSPSTVPMQSSKGSSEQERMELFWHMATRALNTKALYSSARAILSSEYWTLEYTALLDALRCISAGEFSQEDLDFAIWKQENGIWTVRELWRMHEIMSDQQETMLFESFFMHVTSKIY